MSETSLPASWKEAAPSLLWGTFVFAFGFETVVRLFEGHLLHASVGFIATLALTSVLIFWSKIGSTWPQWAATANSVATDARWWIVVFLGLFLYVAFPKGELTWTQAIMAGSLAVLIVIVAFALSLRKRSGNSLREDASTTRLFSGQKAIAGEPIYPNSAPWPKPPKSSATVGPRSSCASYALAHGFLGNCSQPRRSYRGQS